MTLGKVSSIVEAVSCGFLRACSASLRQSPFCSSGRRYDHALKLVVSQEKDSCPKSMMQVCGRLCGVEARVSEGDGFSKKLHGSEISVTKEHLVRGAVHVVGAKRFCGGGQGARVKEVMASAHVSLMPCL